MQPQSQREISLIGHHQCGATNQHTVVVLADRRRVSYRSGVLGVDGQAVEVVDVDGLLVEAPLSLQDLEPLQRMSPAEAPVFFGHGRTALRRAARAR